MSPPRILYVYYATYGSAGAYVAALAEAFRGLPVEVTFAVSAYYRFPLDGLPPNVRILRHFFSLTESVAENPHGAGRRGGTKGRVRLALRYAELASGYARLLYHIVRYRIDTVNLALVDDFAATGLFARAVRRLGRKLFITAHDVIAHDRADMPGSRRALFDDADRIVVHAEHVADWVTRAAGVSRARVAVHVFPWRDVRPVLDADRLAAARRSLAARLPDQALGILAPGYIRRTKGFDRLVDAWVLGPDADDALRLIVAGEPAAEVRDDLARLSKAPNVVIEARRVDDEELQAALERSDLVVLPYREYAHSSVHWHAYLSAERPVLAADIALFRADIPASAGFRAPADRPAEFAAALHSAAGLGRDRLRAMGRAGREHCIARLARLPDELRAIYLPTASSR